MYDVKYAPYANEYMGMANGSAYEHLKRWLKRRLLFTDSLYDYVPSYADSITIRANTTKGRIIEIETYAPVYQHMSWYNNQMDKKKIDGKTAITFTCPDDTGADTDQEVIIYGGSNLKRIRGLNTLNPDSMLIGNASKLVELECSNAPLLTDINSNKANLSPNKYLTKVDISNCPQLGGTLRLNNSPLLSEVNAQGTAITGMLLPTSIKNLATLKVPKGVTELTLNDAKTLTDLDLEKGYLLETLSLSNCNKLNSFDLSKVKNISLDNSYNAEELRLSTNEQVNLKNMSSLKRLVYTPNNEKEEFDLATLKNSPNVTVSTFNCPQLKDFITTAPQRESYGESDNEIYPNKLFMANKLDLSGTQVETVKFLCTTDIFDLKLPTTMKNFYCDSAFDLDTSKITDGGYDVIHSDLIKPYTEEYNENVYHGIKEVTETGTIPSDFSEAWTKRYIISGGTLREGKDGWYANYRSTDYMEGIPNSNISFKGIGAMIIFFDKSKKLISSIGNVNENSDTEVLREGIVPSNCKYVILSAWGNRKYELTHSIPHTPNIVPTSANGSLLFNINTTPTSVSPYIWDLQGMKLNDFHTYGVNNRVKIPNGTVKQLKPYLLNHWYYTGQAGGASYGRNALSPIIVDESINTIKMKSNVNISHTIQNKEDYSTTSDGAWAREITANFTYAQGSYRMLCINIPQGIPEYITLELDNGTKYYIDFSNINTITPTSSQEVLNMKNHINDMSSYNISDITSITMPKRLADYKVQIKNADITPNQYNTMLYPKLVDATLPITGKLDYSKYKGKYLSWAFAYTTNDVARTALDSRKQGQIINDYNKLYGTDYIDIVDVWAYKDDDFTSRANNPNITKAYIELTQTNYKSRIDEVLQWYPNCYELYLFEDGSVTNLDYMIGTENSESSNPNSRTKVKIIRFMEGYFKNTTSAYSMCGMNEILEEIYNIPNTIRDMGRCFRHCSKLVHISNFPNSLVTAFGLISGCSLLTEIPEIPSSVNNLDDAFNGCIKLNQQFDFSEFNILDNHLANTWQNCNSLTYTPILPSNYRGRLTSSFSGTKIATAPVLPDGVTSLNSTFQECKELTVIGNIPSSCADYSNMARGCAKLTTVPIDGWKGKMDFALAYCSVFNQQVNLKGATSLENTFRNSSMLAITPILPDKMQGSMNLCFQNCSKLVTPPQTPEGVTTMSSTYQYCSNLEKAPYIPDSVTNIGYIIDSCTKITEITIPLINIPFNRVENALNGCTSLERVYWRGIRNADWNLLGLGKSTYVQEDLKDLVNDHLEDLYKDKVKISFGDNKITINNTETTL